MMRFLVGLFLSLYFFLLGGYAHSYRHIIGFFPGKNCEASLQDKPAVQNGEALIFKAAVPSTEKRSEKIKAVEIEDDDESVPLKKYADTGNCNITFLNALAPSYICYYLKDRLPFCEHFSYCSSDKFIINRVIRV